jgi:DNA invertase Pin-like site-specific DNA recombinase
MVHQPQCILKSILYFDNFVQKIHSIKENFDANTAQGKLMLTVFLAFKQFERNLIAERTKEGLASARGRKGGMPNLNRTHR